MLLKNIPLGSEVWTFTGHTDVVRAVAVDSMVDMCTVG